jgi:ABC-type nickel/cobalt efflux system permease component RcnA
VDVTRGLTAYPEDLLKSPPAVTSASFQLRAGETAAVSPQSAAPNGNAVARDEADRSLGRFASLVATEDLTPAVIAVALVLSAAWGAMHALGPGHGKTVVAAYLVGERGTGRHALYLGLIVTATHTISVFALGAIAVLATDVVAADDVYFWLSLSSGLLVAVLGGTLLLGRLRRLMRDANPFVLSLSKDAERPPAFVLQQSPAPLGLRSTGSLSLEGEGRGEGDHAHDHHHAHGHDHAYGQSGSHWHDQDHAHGAHGHDHDHGDAHNHGQGHDHADEHGHSHLPAQPGFRGIVALGVAGGIVPCPTALVVMLGAIALDRAVLGLVLVTAFSVGLAGVLTGVGLLVVYGKRWLERRRLPLAANGVFRRAQLVAPVLSALTITGVGIVLTGQALL